MALTSSVSFSPYVHVVFVDSAVTGNVVAGGVVGAKVGINT